MILYYNSKNNLIKVDLLEDLGVHTHFKDVPESPSVNILDASNLGKRDVYLETIYTHRDISVNLIVKEKNIEDARNKINILNEIFRGELQVIFKDNPELIYKSVFVDSEIKAEKVTNSIYILDVNLKAYDPFRYDVNINSKTVDVKGLSSVMVNNKGNFKAKPLIRLNGVADRIDISVNNKTLSYVNLKKENNIVIDNDNYTVADVYENGKKMNALANWRNNFIELEVGENEITFSGENLNLKVTIEFYDTYL